MMSCMQPPRYVDPHSWVCLHVRHGTDACTCALSMHAKAHTSQRMPGCTWYCMVTACGCCRGQPARGSQVAPPHTIPAHSGCLQQHLGHHTRIDCTRSIVWYGLFGNVYVNE